MLEMVRRLLGFQLPVAAWIAAALVIITPYLLIGMVWTATHTDRLRGMSGIDLLVSIAGSVALWPVLLIANVCLP